jgi:hypothetical protein
VAIKGKLAQILKRKKSVITKAIFWKIPHDNSPDEVNLKIGRYQIPKDFYEEESLETLVPKSELTLDSEELGELMKFLQNNYEPFKSGVKAFIPLDKPFEKENAEQVKALFSLPDRKAIIEFVVNNKIVPDDLYAGMQAANRIKAVKDFEAMLAVPKLENAWQKWFKENSWVLGSEFVKVLDEREIDSQHISDFLMEAYDGFLDIVEIKKPEGGQEFWAKTKDHGNIVPSTELVKAFTQASRYIYEVEREANSIKFVERVGNVKVVKPRCILVFGRSHGWKHEENEAYRILNAGFHNITILTYDHVLQRARRVASADC